MLAGLTPSTAGRRRSGTARAVRRQMPFRVELVIVAQVGSAALMVSNRCRRRRARRWRCGCRLLARRGSRRSWRRNSAPAACSGVISRFAPPVVGSGLTVARKVGTQRQHAADANGGLGGVVDVDANHAHVGSGQRSRINCAAEAHGNRCRGRVTIQCVDRGDAGLQRVRRQVQRAVGGAIEDTGRSETVEPARRSRH